MEQVGQHFSSILQSELESRLLRNSAYSMRAYARDLGLSPSSLSKLLKKKIGLSVKKARQISKKLNFSEEHTEFFCTLVEANCSRHIEVQKLATIKLRKFDSYSNILPVDSFKLISEWYHLAILELFSIKGFKEDIEWIAQKLGIASVEANDALERLKRLELLKVIEGKLKPVSDFIIVKSAVPESAGQNFHSQLLRKAAQAVYEQDKDKRNVSNVILKARSSDIPLLDMRIKDFRRELSYLIEEGEGHDTVYNLGIHLVRLDQDSLS